MTTHFAHESGARIPLLQPDEMTDSQRAVYETVVGGRRGRVVGPLLAAIHSPKLAEHWSRFGEYLRYDTCLPERLSELAILTCGRRWTSQVEWAVHSRIALEAGLDPGIIAAIKTCAAPEFSDPDERALYDFARLLQQTGGVPDPQYRAIVARWGTRGVVELTALVGYYTLVAMTLNAHAIPLPDGQAAALEPVGHLLDLPPAADSR